MSDSESKYLFNGSVIKRQTETYQKRPFALSSSYYYNHLHKIQNKKFLVVEDDEICIIMIDPILKSWNVSFNIARDGKQAMETLENNRYDIVLLDINLPFASGIEIARTIKNNKAHRNYNAILIALTTYNSPKILKRIFESGISSYLHKPVNRDLLYEKILECIESHEIITGRKI